MVDPRRAPVDGEGDEVAAREVVLDEVPRNPTETGAVEEGEALAVEVADVNDVAAAEEGPLGDAVVAR